MTASEADDRSPRLAEVVRAMPTDPLGRRVQSECPREA